VQSLQQPSKARPRDAPCSASTSEVDYNTSSRTSIVVTIATVVIIATFFREHGFGEPEVRHSVLPVIVPLFALLIATPWYGPYVWSSRALSSKPLVFIGVRR
jgi:hypothetical protein